MSERSTLDEICEMFRYLTKECWEDCSECPYQGSCDDPGSIRDTIMYAVHEEDAGEEDSD